MILKPNPIPYGVRDPAEWRAKLLDLQACFPRRSDAPDWLVDACYDATFDPRLVTALRTAVERELDRARESVAIIHPTTNPAPCPDCSSPRYWEQLSGGGVDSVCLSCGRREANNDRVNN